MNWWSRLDAWEQTMLVGVLVVFVGYLFLELIAWVERNKPPRRHYVQRDPVAESKRRVVRNGFKSRMGVR